MKTLIIQQVHLQQEDQGRLWKVAQELIGRLNPGVDRLLIDNASPLDPFQYVPRGTFYAALRFREAIGHFSKGGERDGPGRAIMSSIDLAYALGYERAVYMESDCLVFRPVQWWLDQMTKPTACQPICRHRFPDWNVFPFDVHWMRQFDFVGKYSWHTQKPTNIGEQIYKDILGDNCEIIECKGERVEGHRTLEQFKKHYADGIDFVTHTSPDIFAHALEINGHADLIGWL